MIHPIQFSIPEEKIVKEIPQKKKILATIIPGKLETYIFQNENDYFQDYKDSMFGITMKKAGWDCLRHYEIMMNGCIPYFIDIDKVPINTMFRFPKEQIHKSNQLYERIQYKKSIEEVTEEEWKEYNQYVDYYLEYMKNFLTTKSIASYILQKVQKEKIEKILFLSGDIAPDYLRCLTLHGFKSIFHKNVHDYHLIPHIYQLKNYLYHQLYGKGITYTNLIDLSEHEFYLDKSILEDIKNHEYDLIIYGNYHRGLPFWKEVNQYYQKNEIVLLCGEDEHSCNYHSLFLQDYTLFIRELL